MNGAKKRLNTGVRALSVFAWLAVAAIPITLAMPGCQGRECESDGYKDYGYGPGEGHLVNADIWESTPNYANWLAFGPYHLWGIHPVGLEGRDILRVDVYYSADQNPNATPGSNYTIGAGNGAIQQISADSRTVLLSNATCAPNFVRIVIQADPFPPSAPPTDAGFTGAVITDDAGEAGPADQDADLDAGDASD